MKKCRYCGKELNGNIEFCSDECESRYKKAMEKDEPKIKYFISGIVLGMGIDVVVLPFTTPETTAVLGYQKSKLVGRVAGILLIAVGIWIGII